MSSPSFSKSSIFSRYPPSMRVLASLSSGDIRQKISGTSREMSWATSTLGPMNPAEDSQPS